MTPKPPSKKPSTGKSTSKPAPPTPKTGAKKIGGGVGKIGKSMNIGNIIKRVKGILTKPKKEWGPIGGEKATIVDIYMKYVIFLALIPVICVFLCACIIGYGGYSTGYGTTTVNVDRVRVPIIDGVISAVIQYAGMLFGVLFFAFIIDFLAPYFGAKKDMVASTKVTAYSATPVWLCGVLYFIIYISPSLASLIWLVGAVYMLVLLYFGMEALKKAPKSKHIIYYIVSILVACLISAILGWVIWMILGMFGGGGQGPVGPVGPYRGY